ncbi:MAG: 3-deoxy-manno-octulosonate cytidylyltransferase, partial [Planctomycetes bacterium]|nr:3-deoxy-manno-octulosonate cytidylyltransferase [Planctomycetota bacterium]
ACPGDSSTASDPNQVKVVLGAGQRALYFSRAGIPYDRDAQAVSAQCYRHLGIYAYRRDILLAYKKLPPSPLEDLEKLEQLRALEAGVGIACAVVEDSAP